MHVSKERYVKAKCGLWMSVHEAVPSGTRSFKVREHQQLFDVRGVD